MIDVALSTTDCPPEDRPCASGFEKIDQKSTAFICRSSINSEWKGSYYEVHNTTIHSSTSINRWLVGGYWKNEVDIVAVKLRACLSKNNYLNVYLDSPIGVKDAYLELNGKNVYQSYEMKVKNGSVQSSKGDLEYYWVGPQPTPTWNIRVDGFVRAFSLRGRRV
jgi:hypothetical protein